MPNFRFKIINLCHLYQDPKIFEVDDGLPFFFYLLVTGRLNFVYFVA